MDPSLAPENSTDTPMFYHIFDITLLLLLTTASFSVQSCLYKLTDLLQL